MTLRMRWAPHRHVASDALEYQYPGGEPKPTSSPCERPRAPRCSRRPSWQSEPEGASSGDTKAHR